MPTNYNKDLTNFVHNNYGYLSFKNTKVFYQIMNRCSVISLKIWNSQI